MNQELLDYCHFLKIQHSDTLFLLLQKELSESGEGMHGFSKSTSDAILDSIIDFQKFPFELLEHNVCNTTESNDANIKRTISTIADILLKFISSRLQSTADILIVSSHIHLWSLDILIKAIRTVEKKRPYLSTIPLDPENSLNHQFDGIVIHDQQKIIEADNGFAQLFGYGPDEVIGKAILSFISIADHAKITKNIESGFEFPYQGKGIKRSGEFIDVEIIGKSIVKNGRKLRMTGVKDITQKVQKDKNKEEQYRTLELLYAQLRKEKDFTRTLINNSPDMIVSFDKSMIISTWNMQLEKSGIHSSDAIGRNLFDLFPEYQNERTMSIIEKVWKGEKVVLKDVPFITKEGFFDAEILPVYNEIKEVVGALSFSRNITDQKLSQQKLIDQEHFINNVAETSPFFIYVFDIVESKFVYGNKALLQFIGADFEGLLNLSIHQIAQLFHPDDLEALTGRTADDWSRASDYESFYLEYRNRNVSGDWRWIGTTTKIFKRDLTGGVRLVLGMSNDITDRKIIENQLKESQRLFQNILDSIPVLIFWKDKNNRLLGFNKAYEQALNRSAEELLSKSAEEMYPDADKFLKDDLAVMESGIAKLNIIESVFTPKGTFWAKTDKVPLYNAKSEIIGIIGSSIDVTEMQKVQKELHLLNLELETRVDERTSQVLESETKFRILSESLPAIVWTADNNGNIDYYSQKWTIYTGRQTEESLGKRWQQMVHPEDLPTLIDRWTYATRTGNEYKVEHRLKNSNNHFRWMISRALPLKDAGGANIKWFGTTIDIEEEKNALIQLKLSEEKYRFLADIVPQIFWTTDQTGRADYFNNNWYHYTKLNFDQSKGFNWFSMIHPDDRERSRRNWNQSLATGAFFQEEFRYLRAEDLTYRWHLARAVPLKDMEGNIIKWFGTSTDIQEQRQNNETLSNQNQELQKINNDLDNFIYTASHDLKAPISNIEGLLNSMTDLLLEHSICLEELEHIKDMMHQSVIRFKNIISDLTNINKAQRSNKEEKAEVDIQKILEDVLDIYSKEIQEIKAVIKYDISSAPNVFFSVKNFRSIVYNFISNAIKYRSDRRTLIITFRTYNDQQYFNFEIQDNGLGIDNIHQPKIFEMFKRFHDHVEGTGIGLYIVKKIIDNAEGTITLESAVDQGTTFKIRIPLPKRK